MNQQDALAKNNQARQQFIQNCHALSERIVSLQTRNNCLSDRIETLISKQTLLIERLNDLLAR